MSEMTQYIRRLNQTSEQRDEERARKITAFQEAGVATWEEYRELNNIKRRQISRRLARSGEQS